VGQGDAGTAGNKVLRELTSKLGDNNPRIREKVESIFL
jgi:hypothetical protein